MVDFEWDEIVSIEEDGEIDCYDITLLESDCYLDEPNFIVSEAVVHNCGMHQHFIDRKRGKEDYDLHPLLKPILGNTYGVICYQEQILKILNIVGDIPLKDCEIVRKAISKKKEKVFAKYKTMFLENGQKNLGWGLDPVQSLWDQIASFAEYGFCMAHAVAYSYISSRLLYLKAHYPLEFFAGIFESEKNEDKIKEYKLEAEKFGIKINPVDLNKSGVNFKILDGEIYIGFSNIKGVGMEIAQRIVDSQPYSSFEDFLSRFGTEANILKPLIGLKVFSECHTYPVENPRIFLWEFSEHYKSQMKKRDDRCKRNQKTRDGRVDELRYLLSEGEKELASHDWFLSKVNLPEDTFKALITNIDTKQGWKLLQKYRKSIKDFAAKAELDQPVLLKDFAPTAETIDDKLKKIYADDLLAAELAYYGFGWQHLLEKSPDYEGNYTFTDLQHRAEEKGTIQGMVEVQVVEEPKVKKSKKDTNYYTVRVEDADWQQALVTIWEEDFKRFEDEFRFWESEARRGHLLKMRLQIPQPPFRNYTFESPPKHERHFKVPLKKEEDHRLEVMKRP